MEAVDNRESVKPLLASLPERERRILTMRFFGDMTQSQIAAELGISQMHVSRLLSQTLRRLRTGAGRSLRLGQSRASVRGARVSPRRRRSSRRPVISSRRLHEVADVDEHQRPPAAADLAVAAAIRVDRPWESQNVTPEKSRTIRSAAVPASPSSGRAESLGGRHVDLAREHESRLLGRSASPLPIAARRSPGHPRGRNSRRRLPSRATPYCQTV